MTHVQQVESADHPELITLMMNVLLLKLGGQIQFHVRELQTISQDYAGTRMAFNQEDMTITLTLKTRDRGDLTGVY